MHKKHRSIKWRRSGGGKHVFCAMTNKLCIFFCRNAKKEPVLCVYYVLFSGGEFVFLWGSIVEMRRRRWFFAAEMGGWIGCGVILNIGERAKDAKIALDIVKKL